MQNPQSNSENYSPGSMFALISCQTVCFLGLAWVVAKQVFALSAAKSVAVVFGSGGTKRGSQCLASLVLRTLCLWAVSLCIGLFQSLLCAVVIPCLVRRLATTFREKRKANYRRLKFIQYRSGVWKCLRSLPPDPPAPVLDRISGPLGARFLSSTWLWCGTLIGRA